MPTFFFDIIVRGQKIRDEEGTVLANLTAARHEAIKDARTLMSNAVVEGWDVSRRIIEVRSEGGEVLMTVPFAEALKLEE